MCLGRVLAARVGGQRVDVPLRARVLGCARAVRAPGSPRSANLVTALREK